MAIAIANSAQTGSTTTSSLSITSATAGNVLAVFTAASNPNQTFHGSDNISSSSGWVTGGSIALWAASTNELFFAYKMAVGGETSLAPSASGGSIQGLCYFEISGINPFASIETIVPTNNVTASVTNTSGSITTVNTDAILAAVAVNGGSGTIGAWTGTGPITNVGTASSRCFGGYYLPGQTVSAATFTANWTTSANNCMLAVAIKAVAGSGDSGSNYSSPRHLIVGNGMSTSGEAN